MCRGIWGCIVCDGSWTEAVKGVETGCWLVTPATACYSSSSSVVLEREDLGLINAINLPHFLFKWDGHDEEEEHNTWELEQTLLGCELVRSKVASRRHGGSVWCFLAPYGGGNSSREVC
jgi:hypothetical protein